jgi:hypothetical protein
MNIRRFVVGALFTSSVLFSAGPLSAQEIQVAGPVKGCILLLIREAVPARAEWSWWLSGGGGALWRLGKDSLRLGVAGAGAEVSFALAQLGKQHRYGGPVELRWGQWAMGSSDFHGGRGEVGLLMSVGQVAHAQWGTYALRLGGGYGDDTLGRRPHVVATFTGGVRYVADRYHDRGACDPPARAKDSAFASGARLFATARSTLDTDRAWQLTFGVEIEPSWFFPPYSLHKWIGSGP